MFTIDQKVGNHIYVYEVHSYWDKEKKSSRQRRIPIGKRDPVTGQLIPRATKRISREYGPVYFLASLLEQLELDVAIKEHFPDHWRQIILAASFQVAEHNPFYLCNSWLERIYLKEPIELPSQRLSELIHEIGCDERAVHLFLNHWAASHQQNEYVVFDLTSISTYSKQIDFAEWGYNRDREHLPQVNLGMVYNVPSDLPILYSLYPGSVPDVVTLENMKKRLESITPRSKSLFVLDRGFYSTKNLKQLSGSGQFIIPLPVRTKAAKDIISAVRDDIGNPVNAIRIDKQLLYSLEETVDLGGKDYHAHVYFSEGRKSDETDRLVGFLLTVEELVAQKSWKSSSSLIRFLENNAPDWQKYFLVQQAETGPTAIRKEKEIAAATAKHGFFVLLTNTDLSAKQVLTYYRNKDGVEKLFNSLKHGIDQNRLRVHSQESAEGILFIDFISLILYTAILRGLREKKLSKKFTVEQVFYELRKLSVIEIDSKKPMVSELTRKQKDILEAFEIPVPVVA
jgi:transposase